MTDEEAKEVIDKMSEEELNEYIFFALKEMTKKHETAQAELEKQEKIIDEMAKTIYDYASLEVVINCPAEFDGRYNMDLCKMNAKDRNCLICIKEYFKKKVETEEK